MESKDKPVSEVIEALEGELVLRGCLFEEEQDSITIKTRGSLFEIPRQYIKCMKEVSSSEGRKIVEVCLAKDAKLIQRILVTIPDLVGRGPGSVADGGSGACACACQCNCACDCACSQGFTSEMAGAGFRRPMTGY